MQRALAMARQTPAGDVPVGAVLYDAAGRELATGVNRREQLRDPTAHAEVLALRRSKGMVLDAADHDTWSAGSFFTNPVVESSVADVIQDRVRATLGDAPADRMPRHPATVPAQGEPSSYEKLSAAWLIDNAGFTKGYPGSGPATLSTKHTLALTNRGTATAADIVALARIIRDGVREAFGVELVPEPVWVGVSLDED